MGHQGIGSESEKLQEVSRIYRLALGRISGKPEADKKQSQATATIEEAMTAKDRCTALPDLGMESMLLHRIQHVIDGAVIGSRAFVNELKILTGMRAPCRTNLTK